MVRRSRRIAVFYDVQFGETFGCAYDGRRKNAAKPEAKQEFSAEPEKFSTAEVFHADPFFPAKLFFSKSIS